MPEYSELNTEHIKSHLQKYRIHRQRSKDEFAEFFEQHIRESFQNWESNRGWDDSVNAGTTSNGKRDFRESGLGTETTIDRRTVPVIETHGSSSSAGGSVDGVFSSSEQRVQIGSLTASASSSESVPVESFNESKEGSGSGSSHVAAEAKRSNNTQSKSVVPVAAAAEFNPSFSSSSSSSSSTAESAAHAALNAHYIHNLIQESQGLLLEIRGLCQHAVVLGEVLHSNPHIEHCCRNNPHT
jgi:hypothetical protein